MKTNIFIPMVPAIAAVILTGGCSGGAHKGTATPANRAAPATKRTSFFISRYLDYF